MNFFLLYFACYAIANYAFFLFVLLNNRDKFRQIEKELYAHPIARQYRRSLTVIFHLFISISFIWFWIFVKPAKTEAK
jgi:hypothetical protein